MSEPWQSPESAAMDDYTQKRPIPRRGTVEEVASMILYLASDEASFCTGGDFPVDGGHSSGSLLPGSIVGGS